MQLSRSATVVPIQKQTTKTIRKRTCRLNDSLIQNSLRYRSRIDSFVVAATVKYRTVAIKFNLVK